MSLSQAQIDAYHRDGFIIVPDVLSPDEVAEMRRVTDGFVEDSRAVSQHDDIYDLEPGHSAANPRVRRIKKPHEHAPVYDRVMRHPRIVAMLQQLLGPAIRWDNSKLNMKSAGYGAAVEWHQDWAFYPHTNDDLCAVGVMMDDCAIENGPLLCIPGSHRGPVHDHHADGRFCGAMAADIDGVDYSKAVPCVGPAGAISIHHVRTIHGSAVNTSDKPRRLLLYQYSAADAWPLASKRDLDWDAWMGRILCGSHDGIVPRLEPVPVRLPLPGPLHSGSIYEIQRGTRKSFFEGAAAGAM